MKNIARQWQNWLINNLRINQNVVDPNLFADDQAIIAEREEDICQTLNKWNIICAE